VRCCALRASSLSPGDPGSLHIDEGDEVEFTVTDAGEILLHGMTSVPADQRWFWEPGWQAGERPAGGHSAGGPQGSRFRRHSKCARVRGLGNGGWRRRVCPGVIVLGAVGSSVSVPEERSRDELVVLIGEQAGRIPAQDARLIAADGQIIVMAGQMADLIEANEALAAKLARLEYLLSRNFGNSLEPSVA